MMNLNKRKIFFGIPFMTLFMGGMYLAFEKTALGEDVSLPASTYWLSFLKGLAFAIFILFVGPMITNRFFKKSDGARQQD